MRIVYLHQYFNTPGHAGGTRSYEMARRLVAAGHVVTMVTTSAGLGDDWAPSGGWHMHNVEGIRVDVLRVPYSNLMPFAERLRAFFRFALAASWHIKDINADVVFATSTPLTIILPGLAARLWHRIPLVFEVRDLWPELPIAIGALRNPLAKLAASLLEWVAYHASAYIVALSPGMAAGVIRRGICASKVTVIPNSCDVDLFDVPPENGNWIRERLKLVPGQPLVVYTGTFGLINGVGYLVEVAAAMRTIAPEVGFLLVGTGAEVPKVTALAERLGVLNYNLWIWPPIPKAQVPDLLAAATVATSVFIPLEPMWNNSANKLFDALAAGKPIAINHGGWQAEILERTGAGIVLPPDDPKSAARKLAAYLHDPLTLNTAGGAALKLAHEVFNRDDMYQRLELLLRDAVHKHQIEKSNNVYRRWGKRALDMVAAIILLVLLVPVIAVLAIVIRTVLGSPVLFRQQRPGLHGHPFTILKYRTMDNGHDGQGRLLPDILRLTTFGRFLRRTSLDELPELINVLRGEMSLVGPRPLLPQYLPRYTPEQTRRHDVRPGITGWAQINGRQTLRFSRRLEMDIWYVDHLSLGLDFKILLLTIPRAIRSEGVIPGQDVADIDDLGLSQTFQEQSRPK